MKRCLSPLTYGVSDYTTTPKATKFHRKKETEVC